MEGFVAAIPLTRKIYWSLLWDDGGDGGEGGGGVSS